MSDNVTRWLEQLDLGKYADHFAKNDIDWELLPELDHESLKDIGVASTGHRLRIIKAAKTLSPETGDLRTTQEKEPEPTTPTPGRIEAERRQLTVMFCDLAGSTALSTELDPEDMSQLITAFQDRCRQSIEQYQGFIARYMGDGILVYFGYPQAHEDDAERSVRAGLDIVRSMVELNAGIGEQYEVMLAVRVGVATGPVVVGDIVGEGAAEEAAVVGETPNLAARLQDVAKHNQVVVASTTRQLLGALFEYEDLGTYELKGIAEPVPVWRVVGESDIESRYEAKRVGGRLPLVGRQEELGLLVRSWEAAKHGHGQVVLVQGEAGVGKSRLIEALREQVSGEDYIWVAIRCSPYHANSTLYPIIEHLKRVVDWKQEDSAAEKLDKLEAALKGQSLPLQEVVPPYAELLSLPLPEDRYAPLELSSKQKREQTLDALSGWMLEEAEQRPVLHVWEDLHWADPTTLELVELYIEQSPTVSMLNVLTYRPEFVPPWAMRSHMTPITLNRLERPEVEALIGHQAKGKAVPREVVEHIVEKTDGVPLYVEELTKTILESDYVQEKTDRYTLSGSLAELSIPATLQDSLMARLDRLPTLREIAQLGSVLGREFAYQMLCFLAPHEESVVQEGLGQLVTDELLYQRGRPPRSKYIFKHALIQDAAYQSLLKSNRQKYHQQIAQTIEKQFAETTMTQPELLAHHYAEAGLAEQSIPYWQKSGQRASEHSANVEAVNHFAKALELLNTLPESTDRDKQELALRIDLGPILAATKGFASPEFASTYKRARELLDSVGEVSQRFPVIWGLWFAKNQTGQLREACELADELLVIGKQQADTGVLLEAHHSAWTSNFAGGTLRSVIEHAKEGMALYDIDQHHSQTFVYGGHDPGVCCRFMGAIALCLLGFVDQARDWSKDGVTLAEKLGHQFSMALALSFTTSVYYLRREAPVVQQYTERLSALCAEHGIAMFMAWAMMLRGWALAAQGQTKQGIEQLQEGLDAIRATGMQRLSFQLQILAEGFALSGNTEKGLEVLDEALKIVKETGEDRWAPDIYRLKGQLLLTLGSQNHAEAEGCFNQAIDLARQQEAKLFELRASTSLSRFRRDQGKRKEAHNLIAPIYNWFTEGFDTIDLKDARALLRELS